MNSEDFILFKFGTLKAWNLTSDKGKELMDEYFEEGSSISVLGQKDTPRQKEIILEMIEECGGSLQSDWTGEYFTKEEAREYILGYDKE